ncbi:MAG: hypothetical protein D4R67_03360 [Bacteroidetes bacterium]|nr:MAG: hypothetical protein D4R67_03360 [Bacteroidota bacterium]
MLIRATDSSQYIEWQTESLPAHLCKPDSVGVEESVTAVQEEAIIRGKDRKYRSVLFQFVHLGDPEPSEIHVDPDQITSFILNPFISSPGSSITTGQPTSLPVKRVN